MGKLTPSKELRTVYKVLKRIHAAEQLEETDPGMFAPEVCAPRIRGDDPNYNIPGMIGCVCSPHTRG